MQKFVPWSRIRIFHNERTQSTPLDPKLMFVWVSLCLCVFGNILLLHETRCKMGWTCAINAQVRAMKLHQNFSQWTDPIHPHWTINSCFGASRSIWVHLVMFHYYMKIGAKWVELEQLMHMFMPWSRIRIFRNEHTQSTPLDPKLIFVCVS